MGFLESVFCKPLFSPLDSFAVIITFQKFDIRLRNIVYVVDLLTLIVWKQNQPMHLEMKSNARSVFPLKT